MLSIQIFPHLCKSSLQGWGYSLTSQVSRVRAVNPTELKLYQNYAITSHILVEWGNTIYMNAYDDEDWE